MLSPQGRVIMVSGANRGIGLAVARALHAKGYTLSLGARDPAKLEAATRDLGSERLFRAAFDARDLAIGEAWVRGTAERWGRIDGLVNNAAIALDVAIEDEDESAYDAMWEINVKGPLRLIRLALPHLRRAGSGRIVNIASLSGKRVKNDKAGYAMSKFAVMALTHAARRAGWADGVRATALCPGFVATDMTQWVTDFPRESMTQPEDLAELVATVLALPNNAAIAELLVNCRFEEML